jgi:hypothetical protein
MSNPVGQIVGQVVAEVAARIIVGAIQAGFRGAMASPAPAIPPQPVEQRAKRGVVRAFRSPVAGVETIAIVLQRVDTSEANPADALLAQLQQGLVARHFVLLPAGEANARLVVRHDNHEGRATTVDLALLDEKTGTVLWKDRSTNGQLSVDAAKWAAEAALRTLPARAVER